MVFFLGGFIFVKYNEERIVIESNGIMVIFINGSCIGIDKGSSWLVGVAIEKVNIDLSGLTPRDNSVNYNSVTIFRDFNAYEKNDTTILYPTF